MQIFLKSGSLNLLEPSGPLQACNGRALLTYLLTYLLTPWSRVLLARHLSLSWANSIQSSQSPPTSWRSILILSSHHFAVTGNTKLLVLWAYYWPAVPKKYFALLACRWFLTLQPSCLTKISHIARFSLFMSTFLALIAYGMKILATCNHILRLTVTCMVHFWISTYKMFGQ